jgi:hypothetical protein
LLLQEFIDRAVVQAKIGLDPLTQPTRVEMAANSLLPQVFRDAARDLGSHTLSKVTKALAFEDGQATLTDDVLTGLTWDATLYDPADPTKLYAYTPAWDDFVNAYDTRLGYFTVDGTTIYVIEPGEVYEDGAGLTETLKLVVATVPAVPTGADTAISASGEFIAAALDLMVERLRGMFTGGAEKEAA